MFNLPKNIYVISCVMSLSFAAIAMMALVAGLLGTNIAPNPKLATLPLAAMVIGAAIAAIPAALIMQRIGRKAGLMLGLVIAIIGLLLAFYAAAYKNFWLFTAASMIIGCNGAFSQQGRFAIMENTNDDHQVADGLTLALLANLFAAIIGPAIGAYGRDWLTSQYSGSFLLAALLLVVALMVLMVYQNVAPIIPATTRAKRALWPIIKQPLFILAAGSAAFGYGIMSFVMTATPISMHELSGHSLEHTRFIIQSHIIAMFLPSLISGYFLKRGYTTSLIVVGLGLYLVVGIIALNDQTVLHYWWALVLLGLGWNLIYMTSTSILPNTYSENEKFTAQAANDFTIFGVQALASFFAGVILFRLEWYGVISIALAATLFWVLVVALLNRQLK